MGKNQARKRSEEKEGREDLGSRRGKGEINFHAEGKSSDPD